METLLQDTQAKADQGDTKAMVLLSFWYYQGEQGVAASPEKSFEWALQAAESGDAQAQRMVGMKTEYGEGVAKDVAKAFEWYRKAYEGGDPESCYHLATFFEGDKKGMEPHLPTAMAYYEEGAKRDCGNSQFYLAYRCLLGNGIARDPRRALELLEEAGRNGVPAAFEVMGRIYLQGRDAPKNADMAFDYFTRALEFFDIDSAITIGDCAVYYALCLLTGTGCKKDINLGREVLQVAANANNPAAREVLAERVIRNPMIQACFGFDSIASLKKSGNSDWDISHLLQ